MIDAPRLALTFGLIKLKYPMIDAAPRLILAAAVETTRRAPMPNDHPRMQ